jgi:prepilin-type N-terminal cleavage/methylation domain-containing protein
MQWAKNKKGFTIVELLIVIVVIAILAAITIVAFNGVQKRAQSSAVQSSLSQATKKVLAYAITNGDDYPLALIDAGLTNSSDTKYQYLVDNTAQPKSFCITASRKDITFFQSSTTNGLSAGRCPGYNLVDWDETDPAAVPPLSSVAIADTSVYRSSSASLRIPPGESNVPILGGPFTGVAGQTYTISLWIKTDPNWDGTNTNSKIRIAKADGVFITSCTYNGVKTTWTKYVCNYTLTSAITSISLRLGNDGANGNIWIDDLIVSRTD